MKDCNRLNEEVKKLTKSLQKYKDFYIESIKNSKNHSFDDSNDLIPLFQDLGIKQGGMNILRTDKDEIMRKLKTEVEAMKKHDLELRDIIEEVIIFKNDEDFISISHDKTCIIWSIGDKVPIKIINMNQNISSVYLSDLQNEIIISTQNGDIFFRNLPSYELLLELNYKSSLNQQFIVDSKENFLFTSILVHERPSRISPAGSLGKCATSTNNLSSEKF